VRKLLHRVTDRLKKAAPLSIIPPNEALRLAALRRYDVLDTLPEPVFDDLTRMAAHICGTPVALITLVDENRLWFKSKGGLSLAEVPRDAAPCCYAVLGEDLLVVDDVPHDPRFLKSPLVVRDPRIRFYAGMPLRTSDGFNIGTLAVADSRKRRLSEQHREALRILAHQVMAQLELRRHLVELERSLFEHQRTQDALKNSEIFYQALVESLPQNILRKDTEGRFVFANQKFCASLGKPLDEVLGKNDWDFFPPHLAEKYHRDDLRVMKTREAVDTIEANQTPQGERIFVHVIKTPLYDAAGNVVGIQGIFWDVTERKKTEEALAYERDLLRALLENIPDRIYFKDVKSRFLRVSTSMAKRLGVQEPGEVLGKTDFDFYPKERAQEFYNDEQRIILTGQPLINKLERIVDRDGKETWASVTKVPLYNRSGAVTGIIGISRDVSKLKEAEVALEHARDAALETARIKSEFLANMSHEIRTPMNAITGMTDLLLDTQLDEEQREFVDTIRGSTDTLLAIINDILDFSKMEAGKLSIETIDFDLRDTIEDTAEMLAQRAQTKGVELLYSIDDDVPTLLRGDSRRVRQVLSNLISNAAKFTERGEIEVHVSRLSETDREVRVRISVRDTGIGLSQKTLPLIFNAFTQADGSTTRKYGGTGLGLAISKQLVEMMKGKIGVESQVGTGSTFWFDLPFAKQPSMSQAVEAVPDFHNLRILVVDDNATNRNTLRHQLSRWHLRSSVAADAADALTQLRAAAAENDAYAVALLDMQMPGMDGLTLASAIKNEPALSGTRTIVLAPFGQRLDHELMDEAGITQCLIKPVKQSRLLDSLLNTTQTPFVSASLASPKEEAPHVRRPAAKALRILLAEDNAVNQKLALRQLQKLGYAAQPVSNGAEVLQEVERVSYDVILMDCQMPEMDGYEVTRRIRESEKQSAVKGSSVYIIAITAHALEGDRERCLSAGMNDYLTKPLHIAQLEAAINRAIRRRPVLEKSESVLDPVCIAGLKELREPGQADPLIELTDLFNREADSCVRKMESGLAEHDSNATARAAHSLKGSASNLGANRLAAACASLEQNARLADWTQAGLQLQDLKTQLQRVRESLKAEMQTAI
jgi:two-component system, sensor histidine kinase and response regulator